MIWVRFYGFYHPCFSLVLKTITDNKLTASKTEKKYIFNFPLSVFLYGSQSTFFASFCLALQFSEHHNFFYLSLSSPTYPPLSLSLSLTLSQSVILLYLSNKWHRLNLQTTISLYSINIVLFFNIISIFSHENNEK